MNQAVVSKIRIYPIKSLDPIELTKAEIGIHSLKHDRAFALMDENDRFFNGKRTGMVNQLQASYDLNKGLVSLSRRANQKWTTFELKEGNENLNSYFENFFGSKLRLVHNDQGKLVDIPLISSLTIVSNASLKSLQKSFPHLTIDDLRLRFRANIELDGVSAFWEDQLFDSPGTGVHFKIGNVNLTGIKPRARCIVPTRNPLTGESDKTFARSMMRSREEYLPPESTLMAFGNSYHLCVDSMISISEQGKSLRKGDLLSITGPVDLQNTY